MTSLVRRSGIFTSGGCAPVVAVFALVAVSAPAPVLAREPAQAGTLPAAVRVGEGNASRRVIAAPSPGPSDQVTEVTRTVAEPVVQTVPTDHFDVPPAWTEAQAEQLRAYIATLGNEGLFPSDYQPQELEGAISAGEGEQLDEVATRLFTWVAQDLRDGRTEMDARRQWFVRDPDAERLPIKPLLEEALAGMGVVPALDSLSPVHPDYIALRQLLAETPEDRQEARARIRANMDRWRWLARDLGRSYLLTNVPEYQLRLTVNERIVRSYKTIVGKPGNTATPQLAETVEGIIFNPTWTVPQSIVVGEGLGARVLNSPAFARSKNYKAWKREDGTIVVVQQPGPANSLGLVKLDMPNPHAIFLHDTPAKGLFDTSVRAYSHGCIRTERALELGLTLVMALGGLTKDEAVGISASGEYTRVPLKQQLPVYITYFTMARTIDGKMHTFDDIYGRDAPVLASFSAPRKIKGDKRVTNEPVVAIEAPGA